MKLIRLAPLALIAFAATASAQGFYVLGEVTATKSSLNKNHFDGALLANGATGISSKRKGTNGKWRLQAGYRFNPYVAVEAGYIDFGKATYDANYAGGTAHGTLKAGGFDAVALLSLPVNDQFSIFGKAGVVAAKAKSRLSAGAPASGASSSVSNSVVRPLLGIGTNYKLTDNVDLRLDYDHVSGLGKSRKTGKMDVNMVSLGVSYNF